jgi:hypothetical protein
MSRGDAVDALLGTHVVVAGTGSGGAASDIKFGVISTIRNETTQRLRERLDPVPRSLSGNIPVFSVEGGAFELGTMPAPSGAKNWSRLVLSADQAMFGQMLAATPDRAIKSTLSGTREWSRLKQFVDADLFVLMRETSTQQGNFFALAATPTRSGWTSRFLATDSMVLAGLAATPVETTVWPSEAVDALEQDATLLIAGSPRQQAAVSGSPTLMTILLAMMDIPDVVHKAMEGDAIISLTLGKGGSDASSLVVALPISDIPASANACDAWAVRIAGVTPDAISKLVTISDGVRTAPITPNSPAVINTYFKLAGNLSWCYAAQPPENGVVTAGWMVMCIRLGTEDGPATTVRRISHLLTHEEGRDRSTLFRLVVQPQRLVRMLEASGIDRVEASGPSLKAMRWLDRVESRISRESKGMVEGTVSLDLNLKMLGDPKSTTPPAAGEQPSADEGQ